MFVKFEYRPFKLVRPISGSFLSIRQRAIGVFSFLFFYVARSSLLNPFVSIPACRSAPYRLSLANSFSGTALCLLQWRTKYIMAWICEAIVNLRWLAVICSKCFWRAIKKQSSGDRIFISLQWCHCFTAANVNGNLFSCFPLFFLSA